VDVIHFMNSLECQNRLGDIETTLVLCKYVLAHEQSHEISTRQKVHYEVQVALVLERKFEVDYPGVFGFNEHFSFGLDVSYLVFVDHFAFFHLFHRHYFPSSFYFAYSNFAKGSSSDN